MPRQPEIDEFLKALDETQYLSPARMQAYQRRLLTRLLNHARRETAFYAERLDPIMRADGSIDWEGWQRLAILTRSEAQDNFTALCARSLPPAAGGRKRGHLIRLDRPAAQAPDVPYPGSCFRLRQ